MKDQGRSTRKRTGGRLKHASNKKRHQLGREPAETTVGETRVQYIDSRGNEKKVRALSTNVAQVADGDAVSEAGSRTSSTTPRTSTTPENHHHQGRHYRDVRGPRSRLLDPARPDRSTRSSSTERSRSTRGRPLSEPIYPFETRSDACTSASTAGQGPRTRTNGRRGGARRPGSSPGRCGRLEANRPSRRESIDAEIRATDAVAVGVAFVEPAEIDRPDTDMNTLTVRGQARAVRAALHGVVAVDLDEPIRRRRRRRRHQRGAIRPSARRVRGRSRLRYHRYRTS